MQELSALGINDGVPVSSFITGALVLWVFWSVVVIVAYRLIRAPRRDKPKRDEFEDQHERPVRTRDQQ